MLACQNKLEEYDALKAEGNTLTTIASERGSTYACGNIHNAS
jgi:hypothetical protein